MTDLRWPEVTKDPDDTLSVSLGLWAQCAQFWAPNEQWDIGDFAWPRITVLDGAIVKGAIGYVMECTGAGRSSAKEPRWATVPDIPMATLDGSVQWTPRVGLLQGVSPVSFPQVNSVTRSDGGASDLVISAVVVNESTKLLLDYSSGTLDMAYEVEISFVIGGRTRVGRQLVNIANR